MNKKQIILYLVFGVLTTVINIAAFMGLEVVMHYMVANVAAWIVAVLFAFFTNKYFVFEKRDARWSVMRRELWEFFLARFSTGLVDFAMMYVLISLLSVDAFLSKVAVNVFVVVSNYVLSRYWVFKK